MVLAAGSGLVAGGRFTCHRLRCRPRFVFQRKCENTNRDLHRSPLLRTTRGESPDPQGGPAMNYDLQSEQDNDDAEYDVPDRAWMPRARFNDDKLDARTTIACRRTIDDATRSVRAPGADRPLGVIRGLEGGTYFGCQLCLRRAVLFRWQGITCATVGCFASAPTTCP